MPDRTIAAAIGFRYDTSPHGEGRPCAVPGHLTDRAPTPSGAGLCLVLLPCNKTLPTHLSVRCTLCLRETPGGRALTGPVFRKESGSQPRDSQEPKVLCRVHSMTQATHTGNVVVPLQSLLIAMSDGVLITDEAGRRTYANPALSDLVGVEPCSPANDSGPPVWIDMAQHDRYLGYIQRAQAGELDQEILSLEWMLVTATGRRIPALMKLIPMKRTSAGPVPLLWLIVPDRTPANGAAIRSKRERDLEETLTRIGGELAKAGIVTEQTISKTSLERPELARLSPRERDVLEHLLEGHRVSTISQRLEVSEHTVRNHLKSMFRKLGVHSQPELIDYVRAG